MNKFFCLISFIILANVMQDIPVISENKYNKEKQRILNVIINSPQFDSIKANFNVNNIIFLENDVLSKKKVTLKYHKQKINIIEFSKIGNNQYWVLGHFFLNPYIKNPTESVVQISLAEGNEEKILLGIGLNKKNGKWEMIGFDIIE